MTEELKFKKGDKVWVMGKVVDVDQDERVYPYEVTLPTTSGSFSLREEHVAPHTKPVLPKVPQIAIDYYNQYKDHLVGFECWFSDFYEERFMEEFPQADRLGDWLYGNDDATNRQRELALATLIVNGPDAVEVEKEKKYRVVIPVQGDKVFCLKKNERDRKVTARIISEYSYYSSEPEFIDLTESEIKEGFEFNPKMWIPVDVKNVD